MKIVSWNVNGIRAILKKDFLKSVEAMDPDVLCIQETKAAVEDAKTAFATLPNYKPFVNDSKARKGYSGTAILVKEDPINVTYDIGILEHDQEGRVVTAEFEKFFLVNVYVPNSGEKLARLDYRQEWNKVFLDYLKALEEVKPVVLCGDLNVAHQEIDIARPKQNFNKSAGYTEQEIEGFQNMVDKGLVDTFRHFHPDEQKFTYWNYWRQSRERNIGWRIDYFMVSEELIPQIKAAEIYNEYWGSDHCPVAIDIQFED